MIKYNLKCNNNHEFESWFLDSNEFDNLKKKKLLMCIFCSSKKVNKSIMAPMVSGTKDSRKIQGLSENLVKEQDKLLKLRNFIENNFEYVEENFSQKVREIYYDKKSKKAIYGSATPKEREELEEEGIDLLSVPWVRKNN
jgi:hypothetical protein